MNLLLVGNHFSDKKHNQNIWQDLASHLLEAGFGVLTTSRKKNKILRLLDMLMTILFKQKDYQIAQVDVFSGPAFAWAYLSTKVLKKLNKPIILSLHGGNLPEYARYHPKAVKWLLNQSYAVTVPSRYLLEAMKLYRDDLILISNGLDINRYPFIPRVLPKAVLIWLRAFHEIYHPEMALEVLRCLHNDGSTLHLIMVGPDDGDRSLQKTQHLSTQFGLQEFVAFPGGVPKSEVPIWLNRGDIFINTTNIDNTPISVIEAMACGLCIVSTNVGGLPYLLEDGIDALLVPPNDPNAMASAIKNILSETGLAEKLSANARKKAETYNWSVVLPMWEKLFSEMIKRQED